LFFVVHIVNSRLSQAKVISKRQTSSPSDSSMMVEGCLKRAQEFAQKQDYSRAIFELRQAIKLYPDSALCHSTLSVLYFQAKQTTMAGVYAKRSLALDPTNQLAMKIQQKLAKQKPDYAKRQQIQKAVNAGGIRGIFSKKVF
jgi:Tfp pilus assembly protein PilF